MFDLYKKLARLVCCVISTSAFKVTGCEEARLYGLCSGVCVGFLSERREGEKAQLVPVSILRNMTIERLSNIFKYFNILTLLTQIS